MSGIWSLSSIVHPPTSAYLGLEAELHDAFWDAEGAAAEMPLLRGFLDPTERGLSSPRGEGGMTGTAGAAPVKPCPVESPGRGLESPRSVRMLDLGCGSGRLLLPLLAEGFHLEGLDNSPDMLALCRQRAAARGLAPVLHLGDFTSFVPPDRYAALTIPAFSFQHAADPAAALRHFSTMITPGGRIYLTVFRPLAELAGELPAGRWFQDHAVALPDGRRATVETRHRLDRRRRRVTREHRYILTDPRGAVLGRHAVIHRLRWFDPGELEELLERAGFTITGRIADFDPAAEPDEETQILTVQAVLGTAMGATADRCRDVGRR